MRATSAFGSVVASLGLMTGFALASVRLSGAEPAGEKVVFEDAFAAGLKEGWSIDREERTNWRTGPGGLEVRVQPGNMWGGANNAKNVFVRNIPAPTPTAPVEISVTFSNQPTAQWEQANLVWYYDAGHMVKLGQELVTGRLSIVMGREEADRTRTVAIVPLDAHEVELRLQAVGNRVRGEFRTAPWREWREIGECDLPVKGDPKASLHFYNGPAREEHWVRANRFAVRRLPTATIDWPRTRLEEKESRSSDQPRTGAAAIRLPGDFGMFFDARSIADEAQAAYEHAIFRHQDGSCGWRWHRRSSMQKSPVLVGIGWGADPSWPMPASDGFSPVIIGDVKALELEFDVVTRLENDQGDHTLAAIVPLRPAGRVVVCFDWYGPESAVETLHDGIRAYGRVATPEAPDEMRYRIRGFRGAPPRVNLKAFLDDAVLHGLAPSREVLGVWVGNEVWNGSRGGTLVTRLDVVLNGRRHSSVAPR